jgi:hypothetical protein
MDGSLDPIILEDALRMINRGDYLRFQKFTFIGHPLSGKGFNDGMGGRSDRIRIDLCHSRIFFFNEKIEKLIASFHAGGRILLLGDTILRLFGKNRGIYQLPNAIGGDRAPAMVPSRRPEVLSQSP